MIWFQPDLQVTYRPRASARTLGSQYFLYGRWRRVVARQHAGTINLRYLAPPGAVLAMAAGVLIGLAGLAGLAGGSGWIWPVLATAGFAVPRSTWPGFWRSRRRRCASSACRRAVRLPLALATMHICWGVGFLTSPRSLMPGHGRAPSRRLAAAGDGSGAGGAITQIGLALRPGAGSPPARGRQGM